MKQTGIINKQPYIDALRTIVSDLQSLKLSVDSEIAKNSGKYSQQSLKIPTIERSLILLHDSLCFIIAMSEDISPMVLRDEFDLSKIYAQKMNKERKIKEIEAEMCQLADELKIAMDEKGVAWKPKRGEQYKFIERNGQARTNRWCDELSDEDLYRAGNCFQPDTPNESILLWALLNGDYSYWIPGVGQKPPTETPVNCEYLDFECEAWFIEHACPTNWSCCVHRWKKRLNQ